MGLVCRVGIVVQGIQA